MTDAAPQVQLRHGLRRRRRGRRRRRRGRKRAFTADEVEQIRARGRRRGRGAAPWPASQAARPQALAEIAAGRRSRPCRRLAEVAHEHRVGSAELALACARSIAAAALRPVPEAPVQAALEALAREIEAAPRLIVARRRRPRRAACRRRWTRPPRRSAIPARSWSAPTRPAARRLHPRLGRRLGRASIPRPPPSASPQALHAALAAEGLHAEPLIPPSAPTMADDTKPDHGRRHADLPLDEFEPDDAARGRAGRSTRTTRPPPTWRRCSTCR